MTMTVTNSYRSYAAQTMAENYAVNHMTDSVKEKETEKTSETTPNSKSKSTADYMNELAKLAPSVKFGVGNTFSTAKSGKTLTINPKLLEKMQRDPEKEKEMKELIKGVESMTKFADSFNKARGWKTVYRHSYIDENGNYCHISFTRSEQGNKMSEKMRKKQRETSEKMLEKSREKAAERREKIKQALEEKLAGSKDGKMYVDDADFKNIMEVIKENATGRGSIGLDLKA